MTLQPDSTAQSIAMIMVQLLPAQIAAKVRWKKHKQLLDDAHHCVTGDVHVDDNDDNDADAAVR